MQLLKKSHSTSPNNSVKAPGKPPEVSFSSKDNSLLYNSYNFVNTTMTLKFTLSYKICIMKNTALVSQRSRLLPLIKNMSDTH